MEVSRLVAALTLVKADFEDGRIRNTLDALVQAAQTAADAPADASHQEAFTVALEQLKVALRDAQTNQAPLSILAALRQVGSENLVGTRIAKRLDDILQTTPFLLQQAAKSLAKLRADVVAQYDKAVAALSALRAIGVKATNVALEVYEAGILMPSSFTKDDLRLIKDHLHAWLRHLNTLEEILRGEARERIPVTSVSSSSFDLYLSLDWNGALALLLVARGAVMIMQSVRDAETKRTEVENLGYPETIVRQMQAHEKTLVDKGKEEIENKVLQHKSDKIEPTRLNELKNALRQAVDYVLRSMNRGVDVEVSIPPKLAKQEAEVEANLAQLRTEITKLQRLLAEGIKGLPERTNPLLALPEPLGDEHSEKPPTPTA